jgi:uncharacterized membrane protein
MGLKHPVVYGHPLHAILSDLPAALIPTALLAALAERARPTSETRFAATSLCALALASGAAAGIAGWWDWLTMPADHPARGPATTHGLLNTAGLAVGAAAVVAPRRRLELLIGLNAVLLVAAWIGGDLVFRLGWRVRPAEELEQLDQGRSRDEARAIVDEHEREDLLLSSG